MFPAPFDYVRASSVDDALAALAGASGEARVLAGGQSLIPAMRYRLARPALLVDINPLGELAYVHDADDGLRVGATTRDVDLERSPAVAERYALLRDVSAVVADPVVRQMGTVVGSLCHNDPAGDWPVAALASRAELTVRGAGGNRTVTIDDFLIDAFTTAVADGELALEVRFPQPRARTSGAYRKIERKVGDFATASAGVVVTLADDGTIEDAGIAIGAVGPRALRIHRAERLLCGQAPSRSLIRAAADEAKKVADPVDDVRGSREYKREMAGVLVHRALVAAFFRLEIGGLG